MRKGETPEQFGQRMAAARAAAKAAKASSTAEAVEVIEMTDVRDAAVPPATRKFAGPQDVPAGVRPIQLRSAQRREVTADEIGAVEAGASAYGPQDGAGAAIVVESGGLNGMGGTKVRGVQQRVDAMGRALPANLQPREGKSAAEGRGGVLFSDKAGDGGFRAGSQDETTRRRGTGAAEPTGLPCVCAMPTRERGQDPSITWCRTCGGERDGVARPENALRGKSIRDIRDALGSGSASAALDYEAIAQRAAQMIVNDGTLAEQIAGYVIGIMDERAAQFAAGEHSEGPTGQDDQS